MQKLVLIVALCLLYYLECDAQQDKQAKELTENDDHSFFKTRLSYLSNSVYNGRKDSLPIPYLTPSLEYFHKSGLFIKTSMSYLISSYAKRVDLVELGAGYQFQLHDQLSGSISANKPFYNASSVSTLSETLAEFNADFSWNIADVVSLNAGGGYMLTTGMADKYINTGFSHEFSFGDDGEWSLEPSFSANFGTRYYYDQYTKTRHLKTGKLRQRTDSTVTNSGNNRVVVTTTVTTLDANKMVMLDTELSLSMYYETGNWSFFATPNYAIPMNPAMYVTTVTADKKLLNGTTAHITRSTNSAESISNIFFMELGLSYKF